MGLWDDDKTSDSVDRIQPKQEGVKVNIQKIEFKEGDAMNQTAFLLVEIPDGSGVHRELPQNFPDPFSGDEQYHSTNLKNYLIFFSALSPIGDYDKLKAAIKEELGNEFTHRQLHDALVAKLDQNYQAVECEYMLCYPKSKEGVVQAYANKPTVGNFIKSKYRPKDLAIWNETYMSLTPGAGKGKKPDAKAGSSTPTKRNTDKDNF